MALTTEQFMLEIQRALLGEVSPHLRAVTIQHSDNMLHFDAYFDGEIDEDDVESMWCVDTELVAALPETIQVTHSSHRIDSPMRLPKKDITVYLRRE